MLQIGKNELNKIINHGISGLPNEACGLIGGEIIHDVKVIKEVYPVRNLDESREHFSMDPREQLAAIKDLRSKGYVLFGNFHSHPETPARLSEEDKRLAYDPKACYLILSLVDRKNPVLKAFLIEAGEFREEQIRYFET